jgi:hypothetical protein
MSPRPRHLHAVRDDEPDDSGRRDAPRRSWSALVLLSLALGLALAANGVLLWKRHGYRAEEARFRAAMSEVERRQADAILARNAGRAERLRLGAELLRRQAHLDADLHLTVALDSGVMYFERDGAVLRDMPVQVAPERRVGIAPDTIRMAPPRGARTVERVLDERAPWEVPAWVWTDRGLEPPADRIVRGALGPAAIVLVGGTVIYSMPSAGPHNDSAYVLPGSVRARADDIRALAASLKPGMTVYLY